jgi:hypothetical protein
MPIKLKSSGGGDVTLDVPSTASTYTLTLPATTATVATTTGTLTNPTINGFTGDTSIINVGSGQLYKDASGNVGIGTSSPSEKLQVVGNIVTTADASGQYLKLRGRSSDNFGQIAFYDNTGANIKGLIQCQGDNAISFVQNSSGSLFERARIDSSGRFLIGTSTAGGVGVSFYSPTTSTNLVINKNTNATNDNVTFQYNGSTIGTISTTTANTAYNTSSDYRLKNSVAPLNSGIATVAALKPVTYKWNADNSDGEGFIAHELQEVIPLAVTGKKDAVNEDGSIKPQGVDYSKIVVHLVAAIQELKAELDATKAEVAALKGAV